MARSQRSTNIVTSQQDALLYSNRLSNSSLVVAVVYEEENLVTALVPSDTACFANSPGSISRTAV